MAPNVKAWTVDDLAAMPDDGQRYEVIDGPAKAAALKTVANPTISIRAKDRRMRPQAITVVHSPSSLSGESARGASPTLGVSCTR
jgi:hypothetical protein